MLYILTGQIQTGKTRWLQQFIAKNEANGAPVYGVVAPGVWRDHGEQADPRFEKLGIDNELLPDHRVIHFARRRDLTSEGDAYAQGKQAAREKLGWAISDDAIAEVDAHFANLLDTCDQLDSNCEGENDRSPAGAPIDSRTINAGWLIVDELGRLELMRGEGLVHALALLKKGPTRLAPNALAVVREDLVPYALDQLKEAWTDIELIHPGSSD